jgi:transposase
MPPRRSYGIEINSNRRSNAELSTIARNSIISKHEAGASNPELAFEFGCTPKCIRDTLRRYAQTGSNQSRPRSGRPQVLSVHDNRMLYRTARKAPKLEYTELLREAGLTRISKTTAYRALKHQGLTNFRATRKPRINQTTAQARCKFERKYRNFNWRRTPMIFSDECSIQVTAGHSQEWCFRYPTEKYRHEMVTEVSMGRARAQMV